jgi:hypothetical protein
VDHWRSVFWRIFLENNMLCNKFLRSNKVWHNSFANFLEECMFSSKILRSKSNRIIVWNFWGSTRICKKKIDYMFCSKHLKNNKVWQKQYVESWSYRKFDIIIMCLFEVQYYSNMCKGCVCLVFKNVLLLLREIVVNIMFNVYVGFLYGWF